MYINTCQLTPNILDLERICLVPKSDHQIAVGIQNTIEEYYFGRAEGRGVLNVYFSLFCKPSIIADLQM
jgi:hypothetical protein